MKEIEIDRTVKIGHNITVRYRGVYYRDSVLRDTVHVPLVLSVSWNADEKTRDVGQVFVVPIRNDHFDEKTIEFMVEGYLQGLYEGVNCVVQFLPHERAKDNP